MAELKLHRIDATWVSTRYEGIDAAIDLPAIGASLKLADVFEGFEFAD